MIQKASIVIFITLLAVLILNRNWIENLYLNFSNGFPKIEQFINDNVVEQIKKQINTPPPLRAKKESPKSFLTISGVIKFTNMQRVQNNLPPLKENPLLDLSAANKAKDMFEKQYFEHNSPTGQGVSNLTHLHFFQ